MPAKHIWCSPNQPFPPQCQALHLGARCTGNTDDPSVRRDTGASAVVWRVLQEKVRSSHLGAGSKATINQRFALSAAKETGTCSAREQGALSVPPGCPVPVLWVKGR